MRRWGRWVNNREIWGVAVGVFSRGLWWIGYYIRFQQAQFDVTATYCGILFLGLLGYALNRLFLLVEHRVLFWHYGSVGEPAR